MTLDIGPGVNIQPHFDQPVVRVDRRIETKPTVVADARALPFKSSVFSTVYASHVLEHFKRNDSEMLLTEWYRVCAIDGELQVFVPNIEWAMVQILNNIVDGSVWHCIFGRQDYELDVHRSGWTPNEVRKLLEGIQGEGEYIMKLFRNSICVWLTKCA